MNNHERYDIENSAILFEDVWAEESVAAPCAACGAAMTKDASACITCGAPAPVCVGSCGACGLPVCVRPSGR